ncbi:MAG: GFA family protein [Pseudomonadota bacterium]
MKRGHCLCGATRFAYSGPETWRGHCHCESCRRQTASPFTTFMGVPNGAWRWEGEAPQVYASSPGVKRYFCGTCGAPMAYASERFPDEIHFYASLLDEPADFTPQAHFHHSERLPWVHLADDLPKKG